MLEAFPCHDVIMGNEVLEQQQIKFISHSCVAYGSKPSIYTTEPNYGYNGFILVYVSKICIRVFVVYLSISPWWSMHTCLEWMKWEAVWKGF